MRPRLPPLGGSSTPFPSSSATLPFSKLDGNACSSLLTAEVALAEQPQDDLIHLRSNDPGGYVGFGSSLTEDVGHILNRSSPVAQVDHLLLNPGQWPAGRLKQE